MKGARARARNGRRGFDRHCADRLVTTDEEDVKKSDAGRRKKTRPGPFLVVQVCDPTAPAVSHTQSSLPLLNLPCGWCTCGVIVDDRCARAKEREGSVKAKCVPGLRTSLLDPFDARRSASGRWAERRGGSGQPAARVHPAPGSRGAEAQRLPPSRVVARRRRPWRARQRNHMRKKCFIARSDGPAGSSQGVGPEYVCVGVCDPTLKFATVSRLPPTPCIR